MSVDLQMGKSNKSIDRAAVFVTDGNFAVQVTDLEKAEEFYGYVLGFKLLKKTNEELVYDTGKITL